MHRTTAITPTKSKTEPFDKVRKVTRDYTLAAIDAIAKSNGTGKPLRFVYFSGLVMTRDLNQDWDAYKAFVSPEYLKMRVSLLAIFNKYPAIVSIPLNDDLALKEIFLL